MLFVSSNGGEDALIAAIEFESRAEWANDEGCGDRGLMLIQNHCVIAAKIKWCNDDINMKVVGLKRRMGDVKG